MHTLPYLLIICTVLLSSYGLKFDSGLVEFKLSCNGILCNEKKVFNLMTSIQEFSKAKVELYHIWGENVTLLICGGEKSISSILNEINGNPAKFEGAKVGIIKWNYFGCKANSLLWSTISGFLSFL